MVGVRKLSSELELDTSVTGVMKSTVSKRSLADLGDAGDFVGVFITSSSVSLSLLSTNLLTFLGLSILNLFGVLN